MLVATLLGLAALSALCWLLFALAVHALPFLAGLWAALLALDLGSGAFSAFLVGLAAGTGTLAIGEVLAAADRSPVQRTLVALVFAGPAAVAGYHASYALSGLGALSDPWRQGFALIGAVAVGATAWTRVRTLYLSHAGSGAAPGRRLVRRVAVSSRRRRHSPLRRRW